MAVGIPCPTVFFLVRLQAVGTKRTVFFVAARTLLKHQELARLARKEDLMDTLNPIRVMVVDDHNMVRRGLAVFLGVNADLKLVAEARDGQEALQMCEQAQPDVVLMDLMLPQMDGTAAMRLIRERWPRVQIVALTSFHEPELVRGAFRAGAIGYLLKGVSGEELLDAIRAAHAGQITLSPDLAQALTQSTDQALWLGHAPSSHEAQTSMMEKTNDPI
jgi:DNA-binding NarL/FixJ family response regulator